MRQGFALPLLLAIASLAAVAAQQEPPRAPTFRSGTQVVELDVRVFDEQGRFVTGLTRDEFEVIEDGTPQQLQTLFFVDDAGVQPGVDPALAPGEPAGPRPRQTWIFFFDLLHLTPGAGYDRARQAVDAFIRDRFRDGDIGGILAGDKMIHNRLTSVRQELLDAVQQVKPLADSRSRWMELTREWPRLVNEEEALRAARGEREPLQRATQRACTDDPDQCPIADQAVRQKGQRLAGDIQRASLRTLSSLDALAAGLAKVPGPKTIVFLSDGFVAQEVDAALRRVVGQVARSGARVYAIDVRGLDRTGGGIIDQPQAEDTAGAPASFDAVADASNSLAVDTGGMMIRNQNNIGRALEVIAADANRYYVLGYEPSNRNWDGTYRGVRVRVKRDGTRVRARKGYLALEPSRLTPPEALKPVEKPPAPAAPADRPAPPALASVVPEPPEPAPAASTPASTVNSVETGSPDASLRIGPDATSRVNELAAADTTAATRLAADGWAAYQRGDLESAIGPLTEAAAQPGARPWVLYALGLTQGALGQPREAIATWERLRTAAPDARAVYDDLAATYASLSDLTEALAVLRDAERRWPKDPEVLNGIGVIHFRRGALDEAITAFTRAAAAAPGEPLAFLNLGRAYELRFTRSRRYVTSQRRWVMDESDRRRAVEQYQHCIRLGGAYVSAATEALQRLDWSK